MHTIKLTVITLSVLSVLAWAGVRVVNGITYDREVSGHLKLAADANSTELAEKQLALAIQGMDARGLCNDGGECFTSIVYQTPDEDVGYWRENIEGTFADLRDMSTEERADNLIESNQLIKVRETILDAGANGDTVTDPRGVSIYGSNVPFAWWLSLSLVIGCGTLATAVERY